jgi:dihydroorotate dehydrogenase (NAD+) catalytic subunit
MPLEREVFGRTFRNPLLLAAGTAGFGRELEGALDWHAVGGIVTKAVSLAPRVGNRPPRVAEFAGGMMNAVGLANPGLAHVQADELPWLAAHAGQTRVLVNVVGFAEAEYAEVIEGLDQFDVITAYELNLSCPNTHAGGIEFGADPTSVARVVAACRKQTSRPIVAKLSPALPDVAGIALAARDAGADAVSVVNTMPGLMQHSDGTPRLGNRFGGISGPTLLAVGTLAVSRILERTGGMTVIGTGGVRTAEDVRQYLRVGATLVALGTAMMADPHLPARLARELERRDG